MTIAIHNSPWGFSNDWIAYCKRKGISHKIVDCYSTSIVKDVENCEIVMWHHHHSDAKDVLFARELLFALQHSGKQVFPDFNVGWHFDDKVAQKYLLEAINAPLASTFVFYRKEEAKGWAKKTSFPKVFKLRSGAGSTNVRLVKSLAEANEIIDKIFGKGFPSYDRLGDLKENIRRYRNHLTNFYEVLKSIRRVAVSTLYSKTVGRHKGYVLFQDFIQGNDSDIRVITIGRKAFAIKRMVRPNDFRASGSGSILYDKNQIPESYIRTAFETSAKLNADVVAYDFVSLNGQPLIVEINYGYAHEAYFKCQGYWDTNLNWHKCSFNSAEWIIELMIEKLQSSNKAIESY